MFGNPYTNPKEWETGKLEDVMVGKASNGFFTKPANYSPDGNVGVICVGDVVNRKYSNVCDLRRATADEKQIQKFKVQYGDMLFCRSSLVKEGIAKASIVPKDSSEDVLFECHVIRVKLDLDRVIPEFMQAFTITDYFRNQMMDKSKTATMTTIGQKDVISGTIYIPDMDLQKQFVHFAAQSDKSKFYGKSQFIEMFGDIENNCKGYPIKQIDEFSDLFAGATPSTKVSAYWESGTIPWMSSGEVHMGRVTSTEKKITQLGYDKCSTKMVPLHTVVIALAGQGKTRGTVAITEIELCTNQSLCAMITDGTVLSEYLFHNLNNRYEEIRNMCAIAGGRGGLNLKIVGRIKVIVPSIEEQKRFVAFAEQSDKSKLSSIG